MKPAEDGFALPAVLVVVGMLTLVFLVAVMALDTLAGQTLRARQRVEFEQAALSLEAKAAWQGLVEPLGQDAILIGGPRAVSNPGQAAPDPFADRRIVPLHLDGRPYGVAGGRLAVSLWDGAGQVNLDAIPPEARIRLLEALGAPPASRALLADRWGDAIDSDDLKRMNGAEAADYASAGLAPPRNTAFVRTSELLGLLGWKQAVPQAAWMKARDLVTVDPVNSAVNVNTASPQALEILLGLSPDQAKVAVAARSQAPFLSVADLARAVGPIAFDVERSYTRPNGRMLVKVTAPRDGLVYRARIVLTPDGLERPLWIEERSLSEATDAERTPLPADAPVFPDPAH